MVSRVLSISRILFCNEFFNFESFLLFLNNFESFHFFIFSQNESRTGSGFYGTRLPGRDIPSCMTVISSRDLWIYEITGPETRIQTALEAEKFFILGSISNLRNRLEIEIE